MRDNDKNFVFSDLSDYEKYESKHPPNNSIVVICDDVRHYKFEACLAIASRMKFPWPLIATILSITPKKFGDYGYDWVANHRQILMKLVRMLNLDY